MKAKEIIIVPTYNERDNIVSHLSILTSMYPEILILVVDDNSPDGTGDLVREFSKNHPNVSLLTRSKKTGLGDAYKSALLSLKDRSDIGVIYTMDADGSHDPKYIEEFRTALKNADLVIGSRYVEGGGVSNWDWSRRFLSKGGNLYSGFLLRVSIHDLTAGFVGFSKEMLDRINLAAIASDGYAYQIEFKYRMAKAGARIREVPIIFSERIAGRSKMNYRIILEGLLIPLRIFWRRMLRE